MSVDTGRPIRFVLKLANDKDETSAVLVSPDQGDAEIPVTNLEQKGRSLVLRVEAIGGRYRGEMGKYGSRPNGRWTQNGYDLPLTLKKRTWRP